MRSLVMSVCLVSMLLSCAGGRRVSGPIQPGQFQERDVPGWDDRAYDLFVPSSYSEGKPLPLVLSFHGGGSHKRAQRKLQCPNGDLQSPGCLARIAEKEGFLLAYPNGIAHPMSRKLRTWNAGGGKNGFLCTSGYACAKNIDDVAYVKALLEDIAKKVNVDPQAVFVTGFSNGGTMAHRLGCEMADRFAAIAPVSGSNQFSTVERCNPSRPIPVLHIHGTADPLVAYEGGEATKEWLGKGKRISVADSMSGWVGRNGCGASPTVEKLQDVESGDGSTLVRETYSGCRNGADVVHLRVNGGGHTWPGGPQYMAEKHIGGTNRDINASEAVWQFFKTRLRSR